MTKDSLLFILAAGLVGAALFGFNNRGPKNYADCILEHMPGSTGPAVLDVRRACKVKFPDTAWGFGDDEVPVAPKN